MRILVFGAGAVGQAAGCMLASAGHTVDLVARERFTEAIKSQGLYLTGIFGEYSCGANAIRAFPSIEKVKYLSYDYVLVTTKSYDTRTAVEEISRLHNQTFNAVSMQNGCGNLEALIDTFGEERSLGARVITGFEIERPGRIRITVTADAIHIGGIPEGNTPESARRIAEALNEAGLPCTTTPYIRRDLFAKLLYNCALNPLGAILGVHYGALGDDPGARVMMNAVIREVFAVIKAMDASTHWDSPDDYIVFFYGRQVPATYNHRPSMLQDIENGKRTEVDALTGYVSEHGHRLGIQTPVCDTLSEMVRFMERNRKTV